MADRWLNIRQSLTINFECFSCDLSKLECGYIVVNIRLRLPTLVVRQLEVANMGISNNPNKQIKSPRSNRHEGHGESDLRDAIG